MDYSVLSQGRDAAFARFGSIYQIPIISSVYDYLKRSYRNGVVLDVGAGAHLYLKKVLALDDAVYCSLDNDPLGSFTYVRVEEIPDGKMFQWMVLNQVLEHLTIPDSVTLLRSLRPHLRPGGELVATVPNIFHPNRFWGNPTHVTPWDYLSLFALLEDSGFQVRQIYRYSKNRGPLDPLSWLVERIMRRLYRIDWCDSVMVTASC